MNLKQKIKEYQEKYKDLNLKIWTFKEGGKKWIECELYLRYAGRFPNDKISKFKIFKLIDNTVEKYESTKKNTV